MPGLCFDSASNRDGRLASALSTVRLCRWCHFQANRTSCSTRMAFFIRELSGRNGHRLRSQPRSRLRTFRGSIKPEACICSPVKARTPGGKLLGTQRGTPAWSWLRYLPLRARFVHRPCLLVPCSWANLSSGRVVRFSAWTVCSFLVWISIFQV